MSKSYTLFSAIIYEQPKVRGEVGREHSSRARGALGWRKIPLPPELYSVFRQAMNQPARIIYKKQIKNK